MVDKVHSLPYYLKLGELQQELLGACIAKLNSGFLVLAHAFQLNNRADAEALMFNDDTFAE